jgi:hypothetical protein
MIIMHGILWDTTFVSIVSHGIVHGILWDITIVSIVSHGTVHGILWDITIVSIVSHGIVHGILWDITFVSIVSHGIVHGILRDTSGYYHSLDFSPTILYMYIGYFPFSPCIAFRGTLVWGEQLGWSYCAGTLWSLRFPFCPLLYMGWTVWIGVMCMGYVQGCPHGLDSSIVSPNPIGRTFIGSDGQHSV